MACSSGEGHHIFKEFQEAAGMQLRKYMRRIVNAAGKSAVSVNASLIEC
jgi:hypothetical protein